MNTKNDTINQIDARCTEIYKTKLEAISMLSERAKSPQSQKCELREDNDELKDLNNYLPNLLTYLWENPKLVATLLSNSNITDVKEHLASLIVNNFYENILSSNYIEDNLMYVLSLMIKEEINKLENVNQPETFLDNSSCGFLLYELRRKNDVQYFFKSVLLSVIDQLEASSFKKINLNIEEIIKTVDNSNKNNDSTDKKSKNYKS